MRVNFQDFIKKKLGSFMPFLTLKTYLTWAKAHAPKGPFTLFFRKSIPTTAVDRYAGDSGQSPHGVDNTSAYLDRLGYYAETQRDA